MNKESQALAVTYVEPKKAVITWLLKGDPSIRWQVMRDLTAEPEELYAAERARIATEGWGARLLALQATEGHWWADTDPWPLKGTIFALVMLKYMGLDPKSKAARMAIDRVCDQIRWKPLDNQPFFDGETEPCINGRILAAGAYFGEPSEKLVDRLLGEQLADGGWNCEAPGSHRSSFHSTINVLEGLLEYEKAKGASTTVTQARHRGQEYLLERRMFRSASTGKVIDPHWARFAFPPTYHYDRPSRTRLSGRRRMSSPTSGSKKQSRWWRGGSTRTGAGRSISFTLIVFPLTWKTGRARQAAGTRSAPCGCSAGIPRVIRLRHKLRPISIGAAPTQSQHRYCMKAWESRTAWANLVRFSKLTVDRKEL